MTVNVTYFLLCREVIDRRDNDAVFDEARRMMLGTAAHPYAPVISKVWNEFPLRVDGTVRAFLRLACPKRTILEPMRSQSDFFVRAPSNYVKKHFIPRFEIRSRHCMRQKIKFHHI